MEEMNCMEKPMAALNLFTEVNGVKITMPCDKLFEALAKMQGALDNAKKESDNPYFKSKYADLATCLQTAKKSQEILRNAERLDQQETWRMTNEGVTFKTKTGSWKNLDEVELKDLEKMLNMDRFADIRNFVQERIAEIKGA